ncbi:MAG: cupin domain-containing protein [Actinobacteria bacterium HGW-Actinobacteria-4]|nr:MAG: cupin domain-containing protein [Actinobacteria bacterium HGW-Actinobacteria-4]
MTSTPARPRTAATAAALVALAAALLAACSAEEPAEATTPVDIITPAPVTAEDLATGTQASDVDVDVDGPTNVTFRRITIEPGAGTGLHCHYGSLIAVVEQGTLTHYAPIYPDGVHEYSAGDSLTEGSGYIHEGKNEGADAVVLLVTYVTPEGLPLAETELDNCDA